jgi:8-oxo-dGTP diphosphatase
MINVTAAVMIREGKVLIARRAAGRHLGGKWEFPGGKVEQGETPEECLARELKEEFEVEVKVGGFLMESVFHYDDVGTTIRLLAYQTEYLGGNFRLRDHDKTEWVSPDELKKYELAPADVPIANALSEKKG